MAGGGNFGDIYPRQTQHRSDVIRDYPETAIRFFPQSIHFDDEEKIPEVAKLIAGHKDMQLFVRDVPSASFAKKHFAPLHIQTQMSVDSRPCSLPPEVQTEGPI